MGKYDKDKWFPFWTEMWGGFPLWVWAVCIVIIEARIGTFQQNIFGCGVWLIFYKAITHKGRDDGEEFPFWPRLVAVVLFVFGFSGEGDIKLALLLSGGFLGCYIWWHVILYGSDRHDNDDDGGY